jgi:hypothetical protein
MRVLIGATATGTSHRSSLANRYPAAWTVKGATRKRLFFLTAAIVAAVATVSNGAAASTSVTVVALACAVDDNGQATVPAGSTITVRTAGWGVPNYGQIKDFLNAVTVTATVDGTPIANANSYWTPPERFISNPPEIRWVTDWIYPTGITLGAGQSLTFTTDWSVSHPLATAAHPPGRPIPAGSVIGGPISCTITAA